VILRARKKIKPGEEITYDYGREYFDIFLKPNGCKCAKCVETRRKARRAAKAR
jgi:SET domain-containing protein